MEHEMEKEIDIVILYNLGHSFFQSAAHIGKHIYDDKKNDQGYTQ